MLSVLPFLFYICGMLRSLQSLRGIFAIMIFLHHFPVGGHGLFAAGGDCGVDFFIMLSGFVMSAGYYSRATDGTLDYRRYMWRRVTRLYPLHLLCLAIYLLLRGWHLEAGGYLRLIPNLFMLQSWIPVQSVFFSGNSVSWCLSDLMFCYAVFPFLAMFYHRTRKWFILLVIAVTAAYFALLWLLPERYLLPIVYIFPMTRLVDFIFGMLLWHVFIVIKQKLPATVHVSSAIRSVTELAVVAIVTAGCIFFNDVTPRLTLASYWWLPSALTIIVFALHDSNGGIVTRILQHESLVTFGNISFSFYMLHALVITAYKLLLAATGMEEQPWIALPSLLIITTALSCLVYYRFELPVSSRLNRILK